MRGRSLLGSRSLSSSLDSPSRRLLYHSRGDLRGRESPALLCHRSRRRLAEPPQLLRESLPLLAWPTLPAVLLRRVRRRPLAYRRRPVLRFPDRLYVLPVRLRSAPIRRFRRRVYRSRDRSGFRERIRSATPPSSDATARASWPGTRSQPWADGCSRPPSSRS